MCCRVHNCQGLYEVREKGKRVLCPVANIKSLNQKLRTTAYTKSLHQNLSPHLYTKESSSLHKLIPKACTQLLSSSHKKLIPKAYTKSSHQKLRPKSCTKSSSSLQKLTLKACTQFSHQNIKPKSLDQNLTPKAQT